MSYFEDYDDMFSAPSKAEQIIEDAKAALWNELTEEVKQLMTEANEAKPKVNEIIMKISSLNLEKTELEKEIKQLREQKAYVEANEVPQKQVKAIVNLLTKDFHPGDECWVIDAKREQHTCEKCGKPLRAYYCEERLYLIECPICGIRALTKANNAKTAALKTLAHRLEKEGEE